MSKRKLGLTALFLACLAIPGALYLRAGWVERRDRQRAESLKDVSFAVRSINPNDEDFRDLDPLVELIGDRRFVLLTEWTHNECAAFYARSRLVRFLHQRMGFDVLAMESRYLDMHDINSRLEDKDEYRMMKPPHRLHPLRTERHVFDYVYETRLAGKNPIQVMGLHPWYTRADQVPERCQQFFTAATVSPLSVAEWVEFERIIHRTSSDEQHMGKPESSEISRMVEMVGKLNNVIQSNRESLQRIHGSDEVSVLESVISSLPAFLETLTMDQPYDPQRDHSQLEARDKAMAQFVLDAAENRFPHRKFIITGATYHLLRQEDRLSVKSMADFLHEKLSGQTYTIVFETYSGAAPGSLPELLHRSGDAFRYLDLLNLPTHHWLRRDRLMPSPVNFFSKQGVIWPELCDGVFVTAEERPIPLDRGAGKGS